VKILLVDNFQVKDEQPQFSGVTYYRMIKPHAVLKRHNDFDFTLLNGITDSVTDETLKEYDLVLFSRTLGDYENVEPIAERLNKLGIKFGVDLDDHWELSNNHILKEHYNEHKVTEAIYNSVKLAHFVICTTPILADEIKKVNKNVYIIENGIDTDDPVWQQNKKESNRLRFGFTQGTTHFYDLTKIADSVARSFKDDKFYKEAQVVLCGFHAELNKPSMYVGYERLITDNLKLLKNKEYENRLKALLRIVDETQVYKRIWSKPVFEFGEVYNELDICVAPLEDNKFNSCKSELKMLEAGFMGCAAMVSGVKPYTLLMTKDNSFDLNEHTFYVWQRIILRNPNLWKDKAAQLAEDVKKYELKNLMDKRLQLYKSCV